MAALLVAVGAVFGAPLRLIVDRLIHRWSGRPLLWGTLTVNVVGSFVLGWVAAAATGAVASGLGIGFCGAFTTFSTFGFETLHLWESGRRGLAVMNVVLSLVLGLAAVSVGWVIGRN